MIRIEKAEFLDSVLKLFESHRVIRAKDLERKHSEDTYIFYQTEKHLKILENDGMIRHNGLDEYHLQPKGIRVLNNLESLGYLARYKVDAAKFEKEEEKGDKALVIIDLVFLLFTFFNFKG